MARKTVYIITVFYFMHTLILGDHMKTIGIILRQEYLDKQYKWFVNKPLLDICQTWHVTPFLICDASSLKLSLTLCDGYILPGGYDLHAFYYHQTHHDLDLTYQTPMDHFDFYCIQHITAAKKPIFGICRGIQLLNVFFKGTLYQNLSTKIHPKQATHTIYTTPHSFCETIYSSCHQVNSYHHQAIHLLGENLEICAVSEDNIIEAIKHTYLPIYAVQWHPELMDYDPILSYFFDYIC